MTPPTVLEVAGGLSERAQAQGVYLRGQLGRMLKEGFSDLLPRWVPAGCVRLVLWILGTIYLRRHAPLHEDPELSVHREGLVELARAAGVSTAVLYGFHAVECETATFGFSMGCTALAFSETHTVSGAPKLAYNHDFPPAFERFLFVRRNAPEGGHRSVSVTYPCLMGAINGVNEHGLALCVNQAFATDVDRRCPALFATMLVQECLDRCATVAEAAELLLSRRTVAGCMVSLVDAGGDRAVIEYSATRAKLRRADPLDVLYTFNNYRLDAMRDVEVPLGATTTGLVRGYDLHRCNVTRERSYLSRVRGGEAWDDEAIQGLLADHDQGPGDSDTICRHDDPLSETILSTIADARERSLKVLFGRPCAKQHTRFAVEREPAPASSG